MRRPGTTASMITREANEGESDALGGLLLVAGLTDQCSGEGIVDAERLDLIRYTDRWTVTRFGERVITELRCNGAIR